MKKRTKKRAPASISPLRIMNMLKTAILTDSDYAWAWHCSISTALVDEGVEHEPANRAAARFMKQLFDVDVTVFDQWNQFHWAKTGPNKPVPLQHDIRFAVLIDRMEQMIAGLQKSSEDIFNTKKAIDASAAASKRPPIGLEPRYIWLEKRRDDIYAAIIRFRERVVAPKPEWVKELISLEAEIERAASIRDPQS